MSSFLIAGSVGQSDDEAMAVDFYPMLSQMDNVAVSYRAAILRLMKQKPLQPVYWALFNGSRYNIVSILPLALYYSPQCTV